MERYYFISHWFFVCPIETVWQTLTEMEKYPEWWHGIKQLAITDPDHQMRVGTHLDWEVRGSLPYTLRFSTQVVKISSPCFLQLRVYGELEGDFRFVLESRASGTAVTTYWDNCTPKPIMNVSAKLPFVRGLFVANHEELMSNGYRCLKAVIEK